MKFHEDSRYSTSLIEKIVSSLLRQDKKLCCYPEMNITVPGRGNR